MMPVLHQSNELQPKQIAGVMRTAPLSTTLLVDLQEDASADQGHIEVLPH